VLFASNGVFADELPTPGEHVEAAYNRLRGELSRPELAHCEEAALKPFFVEHMDAYVNVSVLLGDILYGLTSERLDTMAEDERNAVFGEFKRFFVQDNLANLKALCQAKKIKVVAEGEDYTIGRVEVSVLGHASKKPKRPVVHLIRVWKGWLINDIEANKHLVSDRYRAKFGELIAREGIAGFKKRLAEINAAGR
jgi:ABC-type transporter MlaC component